MRKIQYRLVYNRKKKLNADGTALVQVEAYIEKQKIYLSTHVYVKPEQWDRKQGEVTLHPQAEELNRMLEEFVLSLQWEELKAWKRGVRVSLQLIKEAAEGRRRQEESFVDFGRKWVEKSPRRISTQKNLLTTLGLLADFRGTAVMADITYPFLTEFEEFMRQRGCSVNTVAKHMRQLKTVVNEAIRQGCMRAEAYPFRQYRIKTTESKHTVLLPEELERLEQLSLEGRHMGLRHTLDAFLFCCYTGLRYSDFTHLTPSNIYAPDVSGRRWLVFRTVKTGAEVRLPLDLLFQGKALACIARYGESAEAFFRLKPNPQVNKELSRIALLAQLDKHISFHTARHTNASLLIRQGVPITTVQKLLGHRDIKTTQVYSTVFDETIVSDLSKCL